MPILEHLPNYKTVRASLRVIQDTAVDLGDDDKGAVRALWDSAQAMWGLVRELENLRTGDLAGVYAYGRGHYRNMAPPAELRPLQAELANASHSTEERAELTATINALCEDYAQGRKTFEDKLINTVRLMRQKCLSLADSDLANRIIEVYTHKAGEMQKEFTWAQDSLKPLILNFQSEIASVDRSISDIASKNFFDHLLELMPSQSTINALALPINIGTHTSGGISSTPVPKTLAAANPQQNAPATPTAGGPVVQPPQDPATQTPPDQAAPPPPDPVAQTAPDQAAPPPQGPVAQTAPDQAAPPPQDPVAQTAQQANEVVQETPTEPTPAVTTVEVGTTQPAPTVPIPAIPGQVAATTAIQNAARPVAGALPLATNLSTATPEAVALKAAYEVLQNGLKLFSTGTNLYKLVSKHAELQEQLGSVQKMYDEAMNRYRAIERELDNLERVRVVLNRVADYECEIGAVVTTLKAYTDAFAVTRGEPAVYYELFRLLMDYLERLELIWR